MSKNVLDVGKLMEHIKMMANSSRFEEPICRTPIIFPVLKKFVPGDNITVRFKMHKEITGKPIY